MISIWPIIRCWKVFKLPQSKSNKSHETEPQTFIYSIKSDSIYVYFFEESTNSVEFVNSFIF